MVADYKNVLYTVVVSREAQGLVIRYSNMESKPVQLKELLEHS